VSNPELPVPRKSRFAEREIRIRVAIIKPQVGQVGTQFARLMPISPAGDPPPRHCGEAVKLQARIPRIDGIAAGWAIAFGGRRFNVASVAEGGTPDTLTLTLECFS
jgi:hypothetical protein